VLVLALCLALCCGRGGKLLPRAAIPAPGAARALRLYSGVAGVLPASLQDLHITIFPAIFWLAVTAAFGWRMGLLLAFPAAFFYFAVPSWSQLGNPLQELTCSPCAGFSGSPVQRW